jgi:hypothetical protein
MVHVLKTGLSKFVRVLSLSQKKGIESTKSGVQGDSFALCGLSEALIVK